MNALSCELCQEGIEGSSFIQEDKHFCCPGCMTVFSILKARGEDATSHHPLFQEALKAGILSNPELLNEIERKPSESLELQKIYLEVNEMWCSACALAIRYILMKTKGVKEAVVDYATDIAKIEFDPCLISKEEILNCISKLGYRAHPIENSENKKSFTKLHFQFGLASFCALNIMMMSYPIYIAYLEKSQNGYPLLFAWISFALTLPIMFFSVTSIFKRAWNAAKISIFGMEALATVAILASFLLSTGELLRGSSEVYFDSLAVIVALILGGKIIENKAKFSAKDSLLKLVRAKPKRGRKKMAKGEFLFVPLKEIALGDILLVNSGEKVVLDGLVIEGSGLCDESIMTGEPFPLPKKKGSKLMGGTFLQSGSLVYEVTALENESTLNKILHLIEEGLGKKTAYYSIIDTLLKGFVPALFIFAFVVFGFNVSYSELSLKEAMVRTLALFLIACPCAIGIAAPLVESKLLDKLSQEGIIVKNRAVLATLAEDLYFVFDKTGTLTKGKFVLLEGLEKLEPKEKLQLKSLALRSTHPISEAIAKAIEGDPFGVDSVLEHPGMGIEGEIEGEKLLIGSEKFLKSKGIIVPFSVLPKGDNKLTTLCLINFGSKKTVQLILGDEIKPSSHQLLKEISSNKVLLLSGDKEESVRAVAQALKLPHWISECHPLAKKELIEKLRKEGQIVFMAGDGINDAPALTLANVSLSVASASDISSHVSDILLTQDRLEKINSLLLLARKGRRLIRQNLFWAFFYNVIGIGLAGFGLLTPIYSAAAMTLSSICVTLNARRMR